MKIKLLLAIFFLFGLSPISFADQPVMNEAPRWSGGWGFQVRHLHRSSDKLLEGDDEVSNPLDLDRRVDTTWLEGVYTFDRSKRITVKIPWVDQRRTTNVGGQAVRQHSNGLGDIIIGTPLRKYINYKSWTSNFSLTPSIKLPTGEKAGSYPISDGSTDLGLSLSYSAESPKWFGSVDFFRWFNLHGRNNQHQGNETGIDLTLGMIVYHNGKTSSGAQIQMDMGYRHKEDGFSLAGNNAGDRLMIGPAFNFFRGPFYFRTVYSFPVYEYAQTQSVSYGHEWDVGIGVVF
jgi:hypothetical protein